MTLKSQSIRYDLVPAIGIEEVSKVLSDKLNKYDKQEWTKGIPWSDVLSSLEKHLLEFKQGKDYDENGLLNIAKVAANALILSEYYKVYPQGDDRIMGVNTHPIVCCDLDECIFDFKTAYEARYGKMADYWAGDYNIVKNLKELQEDKSFWVDMPIKNRPTFEVDYYVTARNIPNEWTEEAISKNNLPMAPVISVNWDESKIDTLNKIGACIMIDDKYSTFKECQKAGIFCYLMDSPSNRYYDVGHRRIYDLKLNIK